MRTDPAVVKAEQCRTAWAAYGDVYSHEPSKLVQYETDTKLTPEYRKWERTRDRLSANFDAALKDLTTTQPKTCHGAAALIDAFLECDENIYDGFFADRAVALLKSLRAFLAA